ncbi:MAG: hypothetical protein AAFZ11_07460 [Pseudomonadota bacterium]
MPLRVCAALAACLAVVIALPALAAPASALWGKGPKEVLSALGAPARGVTQDEEQEAFGQDLLVIRPGTYADIAVNEQYFFKDGERLGAVRLYITKPSDCAALLAAARASLGEPAHTQTQDFGLIMAVKVDDYPDQKSGVWIELVEITHRDPSRAACHLTYRPFADGAPGWFPN